MSKEIFSSVLKSAAEKHDFGGDFLTDEKLNKLYVHAEELADKGKKFNLTAITDTRDVALKHFADCLAAAYKIRELSKNTEQSLLDVGSGAGFPALPIAVMCENIKVNALDSTAKKCAFISETAALSGVGITTYPERAETLAAGELRESFDFVTARAVARLNVLMELCAGFLKVGGYFVAMKGSAADEEATEARGAAKKLGLELFEKCDYEIEECGSHTLLVYKKIAPTPKTYPRPYAKIKKSPL